MDKKTKQEYRFPFIFYFFFVLVLIFFLSLFSLLKRIRGHTLKYHFPSFMADIIWPQMKKRKSKTRQNKERCSWSPEILYNYEMQSDPIQSHLSRDGLDLWTPALLCPKREFQMGDQQ